MKIAGWICTILGALSLLGALLGGSSPTGPLFWLGLGIFLLYRGYNKNENSSKSETDITSVETISSEDVASSENQSDELQLESSDDEPYEIVDEEVSSDEDSSSNDIIPNSTSVEDYPDSVKDNYVKQLSKYLNDNSPKGFSVKDLVAFPLGEISLVPFDMTRIVEACAFADLANKPKIRRFLPGLDFSSVEATTKTLLDLVFKTENGKGFAYLVRQKDAPLGMVIVNTPPYNLETLHLPVWTIDFFLIEEAEHMGLMKQCIIRILTLVKKMGVQNLYAIVDNSNQDCKNLLNNFFDLEKESFIRDKTTGEPKLFYSIDLNSVNV